MQQIRITEDTSKTSFIRTLEHTWKVLTCTEMINEVLMPKVICVMCVSCN